MNNVPVSPATFLSSLAVSGRHSQGFISQSGEGGEQKTLLSGIRETYLNRTLPSHRVLNSDVTLAGATSRQYSTAVLQDTSVLVPSVPARSNEAPFIEACPAGVSCPFRGKHQVEVNRCNSLTAANSVLEETNTYLQKKCDAILAENERLRTVLNASEKSAIEAHRVAAKLYTTSQPQQQPTQKTMDSFAGTASKVAVVGNGASLASDLVEDLQQALEDKNVLLSQVRVLQEALEKMTEMNENLLKHVRQNNERRPSSRSRSRSIQNTSDDPSNAAGVPSQERQYLHRDVSMNEGTVGSGSRAPSQTGAHATSGAWGTAISTINNLNANSVDQHYFQQENQSRNHDTSVLTAVLPAEASYLYGGHKGYPPPDTRYAEGGQPHLHLEQIKEQTARVASSLENSLPGALSPYRYGPRDDARITSKSEQAVQPETPHAFASNVGASDTTAPNNVTTFDSKKPYENSKPSNTSIGNLPVSSTQRLHSDEKSRGSNELTHDMSGISTAALMREIERQRELQQSAEVRDGHRLMMVRGPMPDSAPAAPLFSPSPQALTENQKEIGKLIRGTAEVHKISDRITPIANIIENIRSGGQKNVSGGQLFTTPDRENGFRGLNSSYTPATTSQHARHQIEENDTTKNTPSNLQSLTQPKAPAHLSPVEDGRALPVRPRAASSAPINVSVIDQPANSNTSSIEDLSRERLLNGALPPQQPQHYRIRDGGSGVHVASLSLSRSQSHDYRSVSLNNNGNKNNNNNNVGSTSHGYSNSIISHEQSTEHQLDHPYLGRSTSSVSSPPRPNSSRKATPRTPTSSAKEHPLGAPEEGKDNIYSRIRALGPATDQAAPTSGIGPAGSNVVSSRANSRSSSVHHESSQQGGNDKANGLSLRPTTPVRVGGTNPLHGATPVRLGSIAPELRSATPAFSVNTSFVAGTSQREVTSPLKPPLAVKHSEKISGVENQTDPVGKNGTQRDLDDLEEKRVADETAAVEAQRKKERELLREQQLRELEALEIEQKQLIEAQKQEATRQPEASSGAQVMSRNRDENEEQEEERRRAPRRADSSLLSSATRLVKRERIVYVRLSGTQVFLGMLLKDGAGINRRTFADHPKKALSEVWQCFFKK